MSNALKEYYSKKSTEELEEIIRLDVDSDDGDGLDFEALNAILEVLQDRNYAEEYIKNGPTWEAFEKHYLPGLEERKNRTDAADDECVSRNNSDNTLPKLSPSAPGSAPKKRFRWSGHTLKVAGIAAVITFVFVSVFSVGAYAAGYNVWGAVVKWTNETFRFSIGDGARLTIPTADDYSGEYPSLEAALEAYGINEQLAPTWLPDGYSLTVLNVLERKSRTVYSAEYCDDSNDVITISLIQYDTSEPWLLIQEQDNESASVYVTNGVEHHIFSNLDFSTIAWVNVGFECSVSGKISASDAHKIIDSVYER